jgi:rhodanese-related sulfurtransferase
MRRRRLVGIASTLALGLASSSLAAVAVGGCDKKPAAQAKVDELPLLTIDEVAVRIASGTCRPVDANGAQLRKDVGVIPGALLLTDYEAFSLSELPADKSTPLVFYCANEQCDASHIAARRARSAGYAQVHVLAAGILGWAKAGRAVDKPALL